MKQTKLFTKTRREAPKDEVSKNADLLIRAGYIYKDMAGVYSFLPLGLMVLNKISNIIRKEMNAIGGEEIFLTSLQDKKVWEKTGRWSDDVVDNWFKTKLKNDTELGLGFTHEEPLTRLMKDYIRSFRDLPVYAYQIQTKFRNEARAKSGIMRMREFLMKDLYSFSKDEKQHLEFYEKAKQAYLNIFNNVGIGDKTYLTYASGGSFSKYSHEFQAITDSGEDLIYVDEEKHIAINKEVLNEEVCSDAGVKKSNLIEKKAVEIGNIFSLGTRFSEALELFYTDEKGEKKPVVMGCYGIGPGRLMGTVVEILSDDKGLVWPIAISPFDIHIVSLDQSTNEIAQNIYKDLTDKGIQVLFDDRDVRPGEKFADSDLIGIPIRLVIGEKGIKQGSFEVKFRKDGNTENVTKENIIDYLVKEIQRLHGKK
jgi:prolyl-tRNA synthetase